MKYMYIIVQLNTLMNGDYMQRCLQKIVNGEDLTATEAKKTLKYILQEATDAQIGAFLGALSVKGESVEEISGFVEGMLDEAVIIKPAIAGPLVDIVGTGGDRHNTINISTSAAIIAAAAGVPIAKHGNRAVTSLSGSADVLESLGVDLNCSPAEVKRCMESTGIGFLFAPYFHPAMKRVAPVRKELGFRSIFNLLGPLSNPTLASRQVVGVYDKALCKPFAQVLRKLGKERVLVVHGDGMDEISTLSETYVAELKDGLITTYEIKPEDLGFKRVSAPDIVGGTPEENAKDIRYILQGEKGPKRDIVVANAAAAIYVADKASSLNEASRIAEKVIDNGKALEKLEELTQFTNSRGSNATCHKGENLRNEVCG
jgi:anthranilate phosphoribosyltransferase